MLLWPKIIIFLVNVLAIATPIAILEIFLEKDRGWGSGFPKGKWYGKIIGANNYLVKNLVKIIGIPYFFGYLVCMYFFVIPAVLILEYFIVAPNIPLLLAIYFTILVVEDFSWFLLNWNFNSLKELLKGPNGNIWWHKKWVRIYKDKYLPFSYFLAIPFVLFLLLIS